MKLGIVTDSTSEIDFDFAKENGIEVVPMMVYYHGKEHKESQDFDLQEYYKNFEREEVFKVTTSQPSPGEFYEAYEKQVNNGCTDILVVTISAGLSGTHNSATVAKAELSESHPEVKIHLVDSITASLGVHSLVDIALQMNKEGKPLEEIISAVQKRKDTQRTILTLPTLKYLRASGRVSAPRFLLGRLLGLKPITMMKGGKMEAVDKVRNMAVGVQRVYDIATDKGTNLAKAYSIAHTNDLELAKSLETIIRRNQPDVPVRIKIVRTSLSAHTGPGGLGLIAIFDDFPFAEK